MTGICREAYVYAMASVFEVIAEPNRRAILGLLITSEQSVNAIERQLEMSQPTVSKYLRRFWNAHLDALERHLDKMGGPAPTKKQTRRKR